MIGLIFCPHCRQNLYFPEPDSHTESFGESLCRNCQMVFGLQPAWVDDFQSSPRLVSKRRYRRDYQLSASCKDKVLELNFCSPGQDEKFSGQEQDELSLLYAVRNRRPQHLLAIANLTNDSTFQLGSLRWRKLKIGIAGVLVALSLGSVLSVAFKLHRSLYWGTVAGVAIASSAFVLKTDPLVLRDRAQLTRLAAEQQLLQQQYEIEEKIEILLEQLEQQQSTIRQFEGLLRQMEDADPSLYARRIEVMGRGVATLRENVALTRKLYEGNEQLRKIFAIEYSTSRLAEQLPEVNSSQIVQKIHELEEIEERRLSLEALVDPQKILLGL